MLAIDVRNDNQLSGLLVVTSAENAFYSSPTEHGWRCTAASEDDTDLAWTASNFDDSSWQTPTSRGEYADLVTLKVKHRPLELSIKTV